MGTAEHEGIRANVRAQAVCGCGKDVFRVLIFSCGNARPECIYCGSLWEAPAGGPPHNAGGDEAMGGGGNVADNVVSAAKRKAASG